MGPQGTPTSPGDDSEAKQSQKLLAEEKKRLRKLLQHVTASNRAAEEELLKLVVEVSE